MIDDWDDTTEVVQARAAASSRELDRLLHEYLDGERASQVGGE